MAITNTSLLGSYGDNNNSGLIFRNKIINGNFNIWQRATTTGTQTTTGIFCADRWRTTVVGTNVSFTYQQSTDTPSLEFMYSANIAQTNAINATAVTEYALRNIIEKQDTMALVGKPITLSFWYKSNITGTHAARIFTGSGYTGSIDIGTAFTVNAADTWEYKVITVNTLASVTGITGSGNEAGVYVDIGFRTGGFGSSSLAGNSYFRLTGVQLEAGSIASPIENRFSGLELLLCQKYFDTNYPIGTAIGTAVGDYPGAVGIKDPSTTGEFLNTTPFHVTMRAKPTVTLYRPFDGIANTVEEFANGSRSVSLNTSRISTAGFTSVFITTSTTGSKLYFYLYAANAEL
jgi:hypothetical protein